MDLTSDGQLIYHYASGGFLGASEATVGEVNALMAKVSGSLIASGGAVLGTVDGAEVAMGGVQAPFRVRATQKMLTLNSGYDAKFSMNGTYGRLHGPWVADTPFNISAPPLVNYYDIPEPASLKLHTFYNYTKNYVEFRAHADGLTIFHDGVPTLTASKKQSQLHGQWVMTDVITVSDKRFKRNIRSLLSRDRATGAPGASGDSVNEKQSPAWLLRQLRPVSYHFHAGLDSKKVGDPPPPRDGDGTPRRFGFVADELQKVVPEVVRKVTYENREEIKAVAYQDLLALMVAAQQQQAEEFKTMTSRISRLETLVEKLVRVISEKHMDQVV